MQPRFLNGGNDAANETATTWLNAGYTLKVALVYQDALTRQWAGQVRGQMVEVVGRDAIRCTEWKIGDLLQRRVFSKGAAALAQADVIVISLYEAERLPSAFYLWVNVWLQQRSGLPGALVALVVRPQEPSLVAKNETRSYLYAVVSQGHLEFMLQESKQPGNPIEFLGEDIIQWAKAA
jgi:hypothetical protein